MPESMPSSQLAIFAYGSLVDPASASATLGREVGEPVPVALAGWRRRFSQARDNRRCEKTFARGDDGRVPTWILGLNLERDGEAGREEAPRGERAARNPSASQDEGARRGEGAHSNHAQAPNGVLIAVEESDLERLDRREVRYLREEVTASVIYPSGSPRYEAVLTYIARPENLAVDPPADAVILRRYAEAVEAAFAALGADQLDRYRQTTLPYPAEVVAGKLIADRIPEGNPREW